MSEEGMKTWEVAVQRTSTSIGSRDIVVSGPGMTMAQAGDAAVEEAGNYLFDMREKDAEYETMGYPKEITPPPAPAPEMPDKYLCRQVGVDQYELYDVGGAVSLRMTSGTLEDCMRTASMNSRVCEVKLERK
jgi:hypothetical protein